MCIRDRGIAVRQIPIEVAIALQNYVNKRIKVDRNKELESSVYNTKTKCNDDITSIVCIIGKPISTNDCEKYRAFTSIHGLNTYGLWMVS